MPWIELHQSLPTHRKTLDLSDELDIPPVAAVGHLCCLWLWAIDNAPEGNIAGIKPRTVARAAHWDGDAEAFIAALTHAGFLHDNGDIHDWHDYAGKLVERRRANAERMREARSGARAAHVSPISNGTHETRARNVQRTLRARVEREDLTKQDLTTPVVPSGEIEGGVGGETPDALAPAVPPSPDGPALTNPKPKKTTPPRTPAIRVYWKATGKTPREALAARIEATVPADDEAALELWGQVIVEWMARGYNRENISGMLDWYREGGPPPKKPPAANGLARAPSPIRRDVVADDERFKAFEKYG